MKKRFAAEVLFLNPDHVPAAIEALTAVGLEWEYDPDAIDDDGPTVFGMVTGETELEELDIHDWLGPMIEPFSGDIITWGYSGVFMTSDERGRRAMEARRGYH